MRWKIIRRPAANFLRYRKKDISRPGVRSPEQYRAYRDYSRKLVGKFGETFELSAIHSRKTAVAELKKHNQGGLRLQEDTGADDATDGPENRAPPRAKSAAAKAAAAKKAAAAAAAKAAAAAAAGGGQAVGQ